MRRSSRQATERIWGRRWWSTSSRSCNANIRGGLVWGGGHDPQAEGQAPGQKGEHRGKVFRVKDEMKKLEKFYLEYS